jgi:hypothetical protein
VRDTDRVRHERVNRLTDQLVAAIPEQPFGLRIHQQDPPSRIRADDRVRRRLQDRIGCPRRMLEHRDHHNQGLSTSK